MRSLEDYVSLVTGGAAGLGLAIVERYIQEGARVVVLDKNQQGLEILKARFGADIEVFRGDVRSFADNEKAVELAVSSFGKLDVFVGNAGIWDYSASLASLDPEVIDEAFDEIFGINTKGYIFGVKAALAELVKSRGSVILTLSNASFYPGGGGPLYTASKHASRGLVAQLSHEFAPYVRVNGVAPGAIHSDLRGAKSLGQEHQSINDIPLEEYVKDALPLGRLPKTEEYASSYVYFADRASSGFATGSIINIDGGLNARGLSTVAGGQELLALLTTKKSRGKND